jgi:hypothetical protein
MTMHRILGGCSAALVLVLLLGLNPSIARSPLPRNWPAGDYVLQGSNLHGGIYSGRVSIRQTDQTFVMQWHLTSGEKYVGVAVASQGSLAVAFNGGVALYERLDDGTLAGQWTMHGQSRVGIEKLTRR